MKPEKKRKTYRYGLAGLCFIVLTMVLSLAGCKQGPDVPGTTEPEETDTPIESADSVRDMILYWNVDRDIYAFQTETGLSSRTVSKEDGMYHITFATTQARLVERRTASAPVKNQVDEYRLLALTLDDKNLITEVKNAEEVTGGFFAKDFYVESYENGVLTVNSAPDLIGERATIEITPDLPIFDVSGRGGTVGERAKDTVFEPFARVLGVLDFDGSLAYLYVTFRPAHYMLYWNITRRFDTATKTSTRLPNEDGYYEFELSAEGEIGTYYCKDKSVVDQMDEAWPKVFGLEFDEEGFITACIPGTTATSSTKVSSWHTVLEFSTDASGKRTITTESKVASAGDFGQVKTWPIDQNCKMFDTTGATGDIGVPTELEVGDLVFLYCDRLGNIIYGYVVGNRDYVPEIAEHHVCRECGKDVDWYKWTKATFLPTKEGHYFLDTDVECGQQNIAEDQHVVLCLNGHTITGTGNRVYSLHYSGAKLDVMDDEGGGKIVSKKDGGDYAKTQGCVVWVRFGAFRLYGGTLDASAVDTNGAGAAICSEADTTLAIYGGTVIGGTSPYGGAIRVNAKGNFYMAGGTVRGGVSKTRKEAGAMDILSGNAKVSLTGGTITGGVYIKGCKDLTIGGALRVSGEKGLCMGSGQRATLANLSGANVLITLEDGAGLFTDNYLPGSENAFTSGDSRYLVYNISNQALGVNEKNPHTHCICRNGSATLEGHAHEDALWFPWTNKTALPKATGNYYLTVDVTLTSTQQITADQNVNLCLNGHKVTGANIRLYTTFGENSSLAIADCKTGGVIRPTGTFDKQGHGLWVRYGTITLYGGTIDGSKMEGSKYGPVHVESTGAFVMNGGKIIGATVAGNGGAIYAQGSLTMNGGTVTGGEAASYGGSILAGGPFTMNGGTVTGGKAPTGNGGAVCIYGANASFTMNGGTIENGDARIGGNLAVVVKGKALITGGTIKSGKATKTESGGGHGGNVYLGDGTLRMTGGTITGGTDPDSTLAGTNLSINHANSVALITGGVIAGGVHLWNADTATLKVSGGEIGTDRISVAVSKGIVELSGNPVISELHLGSGIRASATNMTNGADIAIKLTDGEGVFAENVNADYSSYFKTSLAGASIVYSAADHTLELGVPKHEHCVCGNGAFGHTHETLKWTAWASTTTLPTAAGNYYLTADVTLSTVQQITAAATVNLCLNGHVVTGANIRLYTTFGEGSALNITDCAGTGAFRSTGSFDKQGQALWARYGTITIYGGTIDGSQTSGSKTAALHVESTGAIVLNGGTVVGGNVTTNGGAVYVQGSFTMNGGTITGGKALAGNGGGVFVYGGVASFTMNGGTITGGEARIGGNLALGSKAKVVIAGGTIENGKATHSETGGHGGNVFAGEGTLQIKGGAIQGGISTANGGANISLNHAGSVVEISGGTVGSGVRVWNDSAATLRISGGLLAGVSVAKGKLELSGNPVVTDLTLASGIRATVGTMTSGADVTVALTDGTGVFAENVAADYSAFFKSKASGLLILYNDTAHTLELDSPGHKHCVCGTGTYGHTHETLAWTEWTSTTTLPTTGGNYYLSADVTLSTVQQIAANQTVSLCLNGHVVTGANIRLYTTFGEGSALNITDCAGGGAFRPTGSFDKQGQALWARYGTITIYGGTIDGSQTSGSKTGALHAEGTGAIVMNGGTVAGGNVTTNGGAVYVSGSFTMNGGTITGGSANYGGSVLVNGQFTMNGGTITGGKAPDGQGGCVAVSGASAVFTMKGGTVSGGNARIGGNFVLMNSATLLLENGTVENGVATKTESGGGHAGNIYVGAGTFRMTGGTVTGGTYTNTGLGGGNISMNHANSVAEISGGTVTGEIYMWNADGNLTITGGLIQSGDTKDAVRIARGTLTISGSPVISSVALAADKKMVLGVLADTASIGVKLASGTGVFAENVESDLSARFTAVSGAMILYSDTDHTLSIASE